MNVLSLFDGMSCGRIALDRLGIKVDNYYASEIDKYAMKVSEANYPDIIQVGDVTALDLSTLPKIDLIMGGSPCQGFSFAGKQLAFDDPRSALFFEFVRCVKELNPKYFLLENVRMKKEYLDVISEYMGVEPICINSALVSAQNRVRYYWTNIPGIEQPEQRGIVLRDILETNKSDILDNIQEYISKQSVEKYVEDVNAEFNDPYNKKTVKGDKSTTLRTNSSNGNMWVNEKAIRETHYTPKQVETISNKENKSYALTASYPAARPRRSKAKHEKTMVKVNDMNNLPSGTDYIYDQNDKSYKLSGHREPKVLAGAFGGRYDDDGTIKQHLELRQGGKTNSLTTVQKDNVVTKDNVYWRKLTCRECERLQTVPDDYTNHVSNTQRYKMLGNGWNIETITHILKNMEIQP